MVPGPDRRIMEDAVWNEVMRRAVVLRRLLAVGRPSRSDFHRTWRATHRVTWKAMERVSRVRMIRDRHAEKIAVRTPTAETAGRASGQPVGCGKLTTNRSNGAFAENGMREISSARANLMIWASGEPKPSQIRRLSTNAVRSIGVKSRRSDAQNRLCQLTVFRETGIHLLPMG